MKFSSFVKWFVGDNTNAETKDAWVSQKLKGLEEGKSILDAGAGELRWKPFCSHLKYTSQDFAQYDGKNDNEGLQIENWEYPKLDIVSDITDIPVKDESFDYVLCTEVLEHVPDPNKALRELVRVTKIGGELIITAPFCSLTHMAPYHYSSGFNKYWYTINLEQYGCEIIECKGNGDFYQYLRQEILRIPYVTKRYLGKSSPWVLLRCALFARLLNKLSMIPNDSAELLCFSYMVVARRVS